MPYLRLAVHCGGFHIVMHKMRTSVLEPEYDDDDDVCT